MENPVVTVGCSVFNMKDYLRQALDGILMQKTDFPFEVIIHDDCSTDGSTDIVREYAEKYPDIIVPIIQTENQFTKNVKISTEIVYPRVRGKYYACCEGDDYWTDPYKLQKQYDFMESHPEYTLCTAKIRQIDCADPQAPDKLIAPLDHTGEVTLEHILEFKEKQPLCTCSMFFRIDAMRACPDDFPIKGERLKTIWLALNGKVWNIDEEMGVYRRARPGSWTSVIWYRTNEKKIRIYFQRIETHKFIDDYTKGKYSEYFQEIYLVYMKLALRANAKLKDITDGQVKECYDLLTPERKKAIRRYSTFLPVIVVGSALKKKIKKILQK